MNGANNLPRVRFPPSHNLNQNRSPALAPWTIASAANVRPARCIPSPAALSFVAGFYLLYDRGNRHKDFPRAKHALQSPSQTGGPVLFGDGQKFSYRRVSLPNQTHRGVNLARENAPTTREQPLVRFGLRLANWSERWFPDPLVFALLGIVVVFVVGLLLHQRPAQLAIQGGKNFWSLVPFTMQMVMIIIGGYVVASTPIVYCAIRNSKDAAPRGGFNRTFFDADLR